MKFVLTAFCLLLTYSLRSQSDPVDYVNVFTGSSNSRWQMFPGATLPFGLVKLSPDNQDNVWNGGYEYTIESISGFSHLHAMCLSGLSIMPTTGKAYANEGWLKSYPGPSDGPFAGMWTAGYRSRFMKSTEKGSPGYYRVDLMDYQVRAELTSTMRCGMMRFTFPQTDQAHIILNFDFPTEEKNIVTETHFDKVSDSEVTGWIKQKNGYIPSYTVYFVLQLNKSVETADAWESEPYLGTADSYGSIWRQNTRVEKSVSHFSGKGHSGVILNFKTAKGEKIIIRSGLSMVSVAGARENLTTEMKPFGFDFDQVVSSAKMVWNKLLGKVEIQSSSKDDKTKFYTNLYRTYTGKSIMNDVDGNYTDACQKIQHLQGNAKAVYSSDALWGTQWDLGPLWTLLNPDIAESWVNALLELADKGGWIPYAPVALGYSAIMGAQHQNSLIISSYQKGIRDFDVEKAYKYILHDYTVPGMEYACGGFAGDRHLQSYMQLGYVSDEAGPASNTLEYAYDDWAFSQFAKALGKSETYQMFQQRSKNYVNQFDTIEKFVRRRSETGKFVEPFDPYHFGTVGGWNGKGFMEGTPFQYSFFVPHDVNGIMALMGRERFLSRLEQGFQNNLFDLGNQPCLATPFLFSYAGKPWLTQYYTRTIIQTMFDTSPYSGWSGEEDEGQLSAYFVLLSLGLFEVDGGCSTEPIYNLTTPLFDRAVIHLDSKYYSGKTFTIKTTNFSKENKYIQSAKLNGKPINRTWLYHNEIVQGGLLEYVLGPQPNRKWGLANIPN